MTKEGKQDEPVAYLTNQRQRLNIVINPVVIKSMPIAVEWEMPLYAKPQAKEWVGLTEDDKYLIKYDADYNQFMTASEYADRVQALTEARLKDKNI